MTFSCGSKLVKKVATRSWKPLNTERVTTSAIVATATPITEMLLITLMTCVDFFENKYLLAMKNGKFIFSPLHLFISSLFQQLINPIDIVEAVVDEEAQFGYDAQLIPDAGT